jgi:fluoroacetyl-CoA thioesterase
MISHEIKPGLTSTYEHEVDTSDTAPAYKSGALDFLLSASAIIRIATDVSMRMLDVLLPEDYITVCKDVELSHEKPTLVGEKITVIVRVSKVVNEKVYLDFTCNDAKGLISRGKFIRVIVDRNKLIEVAYDRAENKL